MKFSFAIDRKTGKLDFSSATISEFAVALPGVTPNFTVTSQVRTQAEQQLIHMARELAFSTQRGWIESLNEVIKREPQLLRLCYARRADADADVGAQS